MSKQLKRKITSNLTSKSKALTTKYRPSVFERLGTKALHAKEYCHHWAQNGTCPYGKGCKYSLTHTLTSPSKQRAAKSATEKRRHDKDAHKRLPLGEHDEEWDWNPEELEDADPDDLEKRRAELQRELELQMKMEKTRKKEKKIKKDSSPSSDSSSSTSESTSSSEDSSSSSSSSDETRRKKLKKIKSKRDSSSSSEERKHNKKVKRVLKLAHDKDKKVITKVPKIALKSPTPTPVRSRKQSQTPPPKIKTFVPSKASTSEIKSPRPSSRSSCKEKHRTPSPKIKEKERDKEREKEKEREKDREKEKEKLKERERLKEKEREKEVKKKERSPKRDIRGDSRNAKDIRRRDSPESISSKDKKISPGNSKVGITSATNNMRRDHRSPLPKEEHRPMKKEDRERPRPKERNDPKNQRKDRRDSRDREKERDRDRERRLAREKEREEALARCQERQRERDRLKKLAAKEEEERRARGRRSREDRGIDKPNDRGERLIPMPKDRLPQTSRKGHTSEKDRRDRDVRRERSPPDNRIIRKSSLDRHDRLDRDIDKNRDYDRVYNRNDRNYDRGRDLEHEREADFGRLHEMDRRLDDKDYSSPYDRARLEDRRYLEMEDHYDSARDEHMALDSRDYVDDRRSRREMWDIRDERDLEREGGIDHHRYGRDDRHSPSLKGRDWDPEYAEMEWNRRQEWEMRENWDMDMKHATEEEWRMYNMNRPMEGGWQGDDRRRWPNNDWRKHRDQSRPRSNASHNRDDNRRKEHIRIDPHCRNEPPVHRNEKNSPLTAEPHDSRSRNDTQDQEKKDTIEKKEVEKTDLEKNTPENKEVPEKKEETEVEPPVDDNKAEEPDEKETSLKRNAELPLDSPVEAKKVCIEPVLEDDLSEISDDADEILNRDEEILEEPEDEPPCQENTETSSLKEQNSATSQKSQSPIRSPANRLSKEGSIDEENIDLDFEEISEDELEEESRVKGIGDVLGVDWASLVAESRPRIKPISSAKKRWESHNVLFHLGISVELAGEEYVKEILKEHAEAELKEKMDIEIKKENSDIKIECIKEEQDDSVDNEVSELKTEVKTEPIDDIVISDPLAEIQVANMEKAYLRKSLLTSVGPYRRALSARRDLMIRRHLCNLPITDTFVEAPKRHDPELFKMAVKFLGKKQECLTETVCT